MSLAAYGTVSPDSQTASNAKVKGVMSGMGLMEGASEQRRLR
ncbi:MAG: hypothetical protein OJF50_006486 [Nitrospira sp.]|nr:hypothetical protein [Nitrospira sp.]